MPPSKEDLEQYYGKDRWGPPEKPRRLSFGVAITLLTALAVALAALVIWGTP